MKSIFLAATMAFPLLSTNASATLVAAWNFNNLSIAALSTPGTGSVPLTIDASTGAGTIDLSGYDGNINNFSGSGMNLVSGDDRGLSLDLMAGIVNNNGHETPGNGSGITVAVSMADLQDPVISFSAQSISDGFNIAQFTYSIDGGQTYADAGSFPVGLSFILIPRIVSFDFSAIDAVDNAGSVLFKITFDGASSNSGDMRIDNLQVNAVPEPAAAALGVLGLFGILRRRRA